MYELKRLSKNGIMGCWILLNFFLLVNSGLIGDRSYGKYFNKRICFICFMGWDLAAFVSYLKYFLLLLI